MSTSFLVKISDGILTIGQYKNKALTPIGIFQVSDEHDFDFISHMVRKNIKPGFLSNAKISFCISDNACFYKTLESVERQRTFEKNIPYEFSTHIKSDFEDEYLYEYQKIDDGDNKYLVVAASKSEVEKYIDLGTELKIGIEKIIPETIAEINVFSRKSENFILLDIRENEMLLKIFKNKNLETRYEMDSGIKDILEIYKNYGLSLISDSGPELRMIYNNDNFKKMIAETVKSIVKTIEFYDEKKITNENFTVCVIGKGALIKPLVVTLQKSIRHKCITAKEILPGRLTASEASLMFDLFGMI